MNTINLYGIKLELSESIIKCFAECSRALVSPLPSGLNETRENNLSPQSWKKERFPELN